MCLRSENKQRKTLVPYNATKTIQVSENNNKKRVTYICMYESETRIEHCFEIFIFKKWIKI
jgi:hypothetical protein